MKLVSMHVRTVYVRCAGVIGACERRLCNDAVGDDDREAQM